MGRTEGCFKGDRGDRQTGTSLSPANKGLNNVQVNVRGGTATLLRNSCSPPLGIISRAHWFRRKERGSLSPSDQKSEREMLLKCMWIHLNSWEVGNWAALITSNWSACIFIRRLQTALCIVYSCFSPPLSTPGKSPWHGSGNQTKRWGKTCVSSLSLWCDKYQELSFFFLLLLLKATWRFEGHF